MQYFTIATPAILASLASAQIQNATVTEEGLGRAQQQVLTAVVNFRNLVNPQRDRAITQSDMGLLNDYGCWCFFESSHGQGRGKPVDELDTYCKALHDGYECIMADAEAQGQECVPWEIPYNSAFGTGIPTGLTMQGLSDECDTNNPANSCAQWTCKVEGWFVQQFFLYSTNGGVINAAYRHENGFDNGPNAGCPISEGHQSDKACCGTYPQRFPFKTYDGARDCCNTHTYNTNLFQCCPDGRVKMVC